MYKYLGYVVCMDFHENYDLGFLLAVSCQCEDAKILWNILDALLKTIGNCRPK